MANSTLRDTSLSLPGLGLPLIAVCAAGSATVVGLALISYNTEPTVIELLRDPLAVVEAPLYYGVLSNLGVLFWAMTTAVALFTWLLLRATPGAPAAARRFMFAAGALTAYLTLDDLFMFHEVLFPDHLGVPEIYVLAVYFVAVAAFLWHWRAQIADSPHAALMLAGGAFAVAVLVDLVNHDLTAIQTLLEDGGKFIGILCWGFYICATALQRLQAGRA